MSHVERITTSGGFNPLDLERCTCGQLAGKCDQVLINRHAYSRKDIEHALKALFGEVPPGTRWFDKQFREVSDA